MDDIQMVSIDDAVYPDALKQISNPPKLLYYRGILPSLNEVCVAIIGTRHPSPYGHQATLQIAGELVDHNITIISGMAPGIDTYAHAICVEKKKRTIAVLGTGLDEKSIYPKDNIFLSRKIVEQGGCLISELPPGTPGSKFTFPKRNRIVSALSKAVVVIEAKEKSGSLITANYATKQKKKLFAVPGSIFSLNSQGPNQLIKKGAIITTDAHAIIKELGIDALQFSRGATAIENPQELAIFTALKEESLAIDAIIEKTQLKASEVLTTLALMEISGKIRNLGGNIYSLCN